jgi:hypothetical protein
VTLDPFGNGMRLLTGGLFGIKLGPPAMSELGPFILSTADMGDRIGESALRLKGTFRQRARIRKLIQASRKSEKALAGSTLLDGTAPRRHRLHPRASHDIEAIRFGEMSCERCQALVDQSAILI